MTAIGRLRKRITLQQPSRVSDGMGGFTTSWSTVGTFWGKLTPVSASESARADTLHGVSTHTLTFRSDAAATMTSDMRVVHSSIPYKINGIPMVDDLSRFTTVNVIRGEPT